MHEFTALLVLATVMSFTPGPNTTLSTALAANGGIGRALPFVCGVPVGWGLILGACALGLGPVVQAQPALRGAIQTIGCVYLLWLALQLWQTVQPSTDDSTAPLRAGFLQGVALQFINIKAWMLALTLTGGWVIGKPDAASRMAIVLPVMMCYAFCSNLTYAALGAALRTWLSTGQRLRMFNRILSVVLGGTALWMAIG